MLEQVLADPDDTGPLDDNAITCSVTSTKLLPSNQSPMKSNPCLASSVVSSSFTPNSLPYISPKS
jgi:hypothetical protein